MHWQGVARQIVLVVASTVLLSLASSAAAGANVDIEPNRVRWGRDVEVVARNCRSGPGFVASVEIQVVTKSTGKVVKTFTFDADKDGVTKVLMTFRREGRFIVRVRCVHTFDAGGEERFYQEEETVRVRPPS